MKETFLGRYDPNFAVNRTRFFSFGWWGIGFFRAQGSKGKAESAVEELGYVTPCAKTTHLEI